ncbi:peptidase S1 and S6, chymotrypsin/Hap [Rhodopseudomonas palustris BisB5]|uniref:Peptidase S1 and S6, chymotrypsin/Hap n=1 Tax=Rhodopseudomonas palustris (strain BisB5) TaxID=316057 RepID=Q137T6_RHOPS|nr:peptidase S1 and S6, chymotrypsin/Hap [Rhodopseudomonas palustris BisB5]
MGALIAVLSLALMPAARSEDGLNIDKSFGSVSGWDVGFSKNVGGCLAAATYRDRTTVWFGFAGDKPSAYIAFTNPRWASVEVDGQYDLQLVMRRTRWNGQFVGFTRGNERGVFSAGLKTEFMVELAESGGVGVFLNRNRIAALSLDGSRRALEAVLSCQKAFMTAQSDTRDEGSTGAKPKRNARSSGTGFYVSGNGHIVTNNHVIAECSAINVIPPGGAPLRATLVAKDKTNDLAILKTSSSPPAVPGLRTQMRLGEAVYVFGFPLTGILSTSGNFTAGAITATTGMEDDTRLAQISAPVQPGNSGGPLLDKYGNVVGVIVSKLNALNIAAATKDIPQNVNFAIKSGIATNFLDSSGVLPSGTVSTRELPPEAIADLAKSFTVQVLCN